MLYTCKNMDHIKMNLPCKYISSPSPKGSPHLEQRAQVGWKWWLSPAL